MILPALRTHRVRRNSRRDDTVTLPDAGQVALKTSRCDLEQRQTLVTVDDKLVTSDLGERLDGRDSALLASEMQLFRRSPEHGSCPGRSALRVSDHLNLINDDNVVAFIQGEHFDSATVQRRAIYKAHFVAGDQTARASEERISVLEYGARGSGNLHVEI